MKLPIVLALLFFTYSCDESDCCVTEPSLRSEMHGEWELVRLTNGFANLILEGGEIGFTERLIIDETEEMFTRFRNNNVMVSSSFYLGQEQGQNAVILSDDKSYHWYSFKKDNDENLLVLYQNAGLGGVLADGSYYEYKRKK